MYTWVVDHPTPIDQGPMRRVERDVPEPEPGPGQVRVRVSWFGVCRTDLHLSEEDLVPGRPSSGRSGRMTPCPRFAIVGGCGD